VELVGVAVSHPAVVVGHAERRVARADCGKGASNAFRQTLSNPFQCSQESRWSRLALDRGPSLLADRHQQTTGRKGRRRHVPAIGAVIRTDLSSVGGRRHERLGAIGIGAALNFLLYSQAECRWVDHPGVPIPKGRGSTDPCSTRTAIAQVVRYFCASARLDGGNSGRGRGHQICDLIGG